MILAWMLAVVLGLVPVVLLIPRILSLLAPAIVGYYLYHKTAGRSAQIASRVDEDEKNVSSNSDDDWETVDSTSSRSKDWNGYIGFFHPFCNAGGGGERVLWAAIRATQERWPKAKIVVYTGDHDVDKSQMIERVKTRFNINLYAPTITFLYLTSRHWVLASTWPHFTLLGQSIGSIMLAYDAFSLLVPDIFVDTMGYAFALWFCKFLFPKVPTVAYVHYPTISTDMLGSLDADSNLGVNAGKGAGATGKAKKIYWHLFAKLYTLVGSTVDVVMTNSSWTQAHIKSLWASHKSVDVVYPPVAVEELEREIEVSESSEQKREKLLLYIAQFRPEKNHRLIMDAFAKFMSSKSDATKGAKLILVGSVRDDSDSKRVYELRLAANELHIKEHVEFHLDASWGEVLDWLRRSHVGVNGMWNEHFGIGVVEYQAAGLISVVHESGGPKNDIVVDFEGRPTGFHAITAAQFAEGFEKALSLSAAETLAMRRSARGSAKRFTEEEFAKRWIAQMEKLHVLSA